jgi:RNase P subunit RPR2
LKLLISLSVELDLWKAQNTYFSIMKNLYRSMQERAEKGEDLAKRWIELFHRLGNQLHVKVP